MASSLVRGKYVISKVTGPNSADVISDGAVLQRDGRIIEVGGYQDLRVPRATVLERRDRLVGCCATRRRKDQPAENKNGDARGSHRLNPSTRS